MILSVKVARGFWPHTLCVDWKHHAFSSKAGTHEFASQLRESQHRIVKTPWSRTRRSTKGSHRTFGWNGLTSGVYGDDFRAIRTLGHNNIVDIHTALLYKKSWRRRGGLPRRYLTKESCWLLAGCQPNRPEGDTIYCDHPGSERPAHQYIGIISTNMLGRLR